MKLRLILAVLMSLNLAASGQKSRVLAVMQMIEAEKYEEAKEAIEEAVENDRTSRWHRTYYAKGLLCQTAYEAGVKNKDAKGTDLYPDQLFVAYGSYEKALELDGRERLHSAIGKQYYLLANDFIKLGEARYKNREYQTAMRAFEHALLISESDLVSARPDTNLIFNTAMAAYESQNWDKAIKYLDELHQEAYAASVSLLLAMACQETGDTLRGEKVLTEGMKTFHYEDTLVMYTVNYLVRSGRPDSAVRVLDRAILVRPEYFRFYWARGLVQQKMGETGQAMLSFQKAADLNPENPEIYFDMGMCYYNMGIDLRESALHIRDNDTYLEVRAQYLEQFREAVKWLEKSFELDPDSEKTVTRLYQLYSYLQMKEEQESLEPMVNDQNLN